MDSVEKKAEADKKTTNEQRTWTERYEKNENGTVADKSEKKKERKAQMRAGFTHP